MTGRTKQAVLRALQDIARDKQAPAKLRWEAAQKLMELEGWGISNKNHTPTRTSKAMANKLKTLASEIVTKDATDGMTRRVVADERNESENVVA